MRYPRLFALLLCSILPACLSDDSVVDQERSDSSLEVRGGPQQTSAPLEIDPTLFENRSFSEAPMLAERVLTGQLPPVAERLPDNPLVVVPLDEIGQYGGTINRALTGEVVQVSAISKTLCENLMGYERPMPNRILYNLAESHTFLDEGRTAIFKLRKGLKWSDGAPFTVDDILFWYHDMWVDPDARRSPLFPTQYLVEGKPIEMEKIDDVTIRFRSHKPLGGILHNLSQDYISLPKHIFARYHPRYNPESTYEILRDVTTRAKRILTPGIPRMSPWVPVDWERDQRVVYERNPYYFKVDSAGNQLPYADRLVFHIIPERQVILLKFINGELDLFGRYSQISMLPTLKANEAKGTYQLHFATPTPASAFRFNWDTPRPELRRAFREKRVRVALSHALNREEIGEIVYHGMLIPSGFTFGPGSRYHSEPLTKTYSAYDPELSRRILDEAGYVDSDGDGIRELDDGSSFTLLIDVIPGLGTDVCQLVAEYWAAVGVQVHLNVALPNMTHQRRARGEFEILWTAEYQEDASVNMYAWGTTGPHFPTWHRMAYLEGPEWLAEATRMIDGVLTTVDTAAVHGFMTRIRDLHTENVPILIAGFAYPVWGASTRLGNVPENKATDNAYRGWSRPLFHEQLYIKSDHRESN
jgi:peptide/nickel transport system substrate-binding protein